MDLPGMVVSVAGGMDHNINALDCLSQARAGLQISLHPLRAWPITSRSGPSTHPTHGIPCRAQLLHNQAAQSSRASCHQNMLHSISSLVSLCFACLSVAHTGDQRAWADVTPLCLFSVLVWSYKMVQGE